MLPDSDLAIEDSCFCDSVTEKASRRHQNRVDKAPTSEPGPNIIQLFDLVTLSGPYWTSRMERRLVRGGKVRGSHLDIAFTELAPIQSISCNVRVGVVRLSRLSYFFFGEGWRLIVEKVFHKIAPIKTDFI